ncbi:MAG: biotin/lipoyl-binding protein, partial [Bacteroidia bacterium]|nr:biotin/lipoyl-binding protein [Bacteroidia bacterium]
MNANEIELHSEEVRAILSAIPIWIVRWGISVIFLVLGIFLLVATLVKYPEVLRTRIVLTTQTLPTGIKPKLSGKIAQVFVKENQTVQPGQTLALLSNSANYGDIKLVKSAFAKFHHLLLVKDSVWAEALARQVNLGEIQSDYAQLFRAIQDYYLFQ